MFCANCGTQVKDGAAFCGNCGAKTGTAQAQTPPQSPPVYPQPAQPPAYQQPPYPNTPQERISPRKRSKAPVVIAVTIAVVVAAALSLFFIQYMDDFSRKERYFTNREYDKVIALCTKNLTGVPDSSFMSGQSDNYLDRSEAYIGKGDYAHAIEDADSARKHGWTYGLILRAESFLLAGSYDDAISGYMQALQEYYPWWYYEYYSNVSPPPQKFNNPDANAAGILAVLDGTGRGESYYYNVELPPPINQTPKTYSNNPDANGARILAGLGEAGRMKGYYDDAVFALNGALGIRPDFALARSSLELANRQSSAVNPAWARATRTEKRGY